MARTYVDRLAHMWTGWCQWWTGRSTNVDRLARDVEVAFPWVQMSTEPAKRRYPNHVLYGLYTAGLAHPPDRRAFIFEFLNCPFLAVSSSD
jgi:hypothetical protein